MSLATQPGKGTAVITGASTGIGAVYASRLARMGYDLPVRPGNVARLGELKAHALKSFLQKAVCIPLLEAGLGMLPDIALRLQHLRPVFIHCCLYSVQPFVVHLYFPFIMSVNCLNYSNYTCAKSIISNLEPALLGYIRTLSIYLLKTYCGCERIDTYNKLLSDATCLYCPTGTNTTSLYTSIQSILKIVPVL